jgi:hypothetical protein
MVQDFCDEPYDDMPQGYFQKNLTIQIHPAGVVGGGEES